MTRWFPVEIRPKVEGSKVEGSVLTIDTSVRVAMFSIVPKRPAMSAKEPFIA